MQSPGMDFSDYARQSHSSASYPRIQIQIEDNPPFEAPWLYPLLGLLGEAGEIAEKFKKLIRDHQGQITDQHRLAIKKEIGDELWYSARLSEAIDSDLNDVAETNLIKVGLRKSKGMIQGFGDDRENGGSI